MNKTSYKLLKNIDKHGITPDEIKSKYKRIMNVSMFIDALEVDGYIKNYPAVENVETSEFFSLRSWRITPKGLDRLSLEKTQKISYWFPIAISALLSLAALIVSFCK